LSEIYPTFWNLSEIYLTFWHFQKTIQTLIEIYPTLSNLLEICRKFVWIKFFVWNSICVSTSTSLVPICPNLTKFQISNFVWICPTLLKLSEIFLIWWNLSNILKFVKKLSKLCLKVVQHFEICQKFVRVCPNLNFLSHISSMFLLLLHLFKFEFFEICLKLSNIVEIVRNFLNLLKFVQHSEICQKSIQHSKICHKCV
jgi:hypothetical protein